MCTLVCLVSGFLEAAAVVGGSGDPNLQSALTIETSTGKDVTLAAVSPSKSVRALGPENQWLGGEVSALLHEASASML